MGNRSGKKQTRNSIAISTAIHILTLVVEAAPLLQTRYGRSALPNSSMVRDWSLAVSVICFPASGDCIRFSVPGSMKLAHSGATVTQTSPKPLRSFRILHGRVKPERVGVRQLTSVFASLLPAFVQERNRLASADLRVGFRFHASAHASKATSTICACSKIISVMYGARKKRIFKR